MRIVSLIASASETVHALGLGEFQVGRSHECDFPESVKVLPVCTRPRFDINGSSREIDSRVKATLAQAESVYEVFSDVLDALEPTHILTQTQCVVCAVTLSDVELAMSQRFRSKPKVIALEPNTFADVWRDMRRVACDCGVPERGDELVAQILARMEIFRDCARGCRVSCLEWLDPVMYVAHWMPDLFGILGAELVTLDADPDAIVCMPCGWDVAKARCEVEWLQRWTGWSNLKAVKNRRVFVADGNQYFNRPGPRLAESTEILAEILAGAGRRFEGAGWQRY